MRTKCFVWLIPMAFIVGCATTTPTQTQLQIREFQTKSYETSDPKLVLKAVLNVLQDDGYVVKNANTELGLLNAIKEIDVENTGEAFLSTLLVGANATWKKNSIYDATANVSEYGDQCRVRMTFQIKMMNNKGSVMKVEQVNSEKFYQDFFAKVDKGVFLQKEKL